MCGIVGYIGYREAYPILIEGLKRLEYRGYDSAGIALLNGSGQVNVYKEKGKVAALESFSNGKDLSGTMGIAHTRWATHGEPSAANAHPHQSSSGRFTLVHNGIIENYASIKAMLQSKGYTFRSSTDTEVLVQFLDYMAGESEDFLSTLRKTLKEVTGAYAVAIIDKKNPERLYAARKSSPLAIGIGQDEFFLASDMTPIAAYTDQVVYLEDGEIAVLERGKALRVVDFDNNECNYEIKTVSRDLAQAAKGEFAHFMLKEIFEQPECLEKCMSGRLDPEKNSLGLSAVTNHKDRLLAAERIILLACGTSWHACLIGKQLLEDLCRIPAEVAYASEFRYCNPVIKKTDVVIAISQSGETADTLAAIELAKESGAFVYGICNAVGSSIPRITDTGTYIHVGPEIGVASTKAFTGQVTVLAMLALCLAHEKGSINQERYTGIISELARIPEKMKHVLAMNDRIAEISKTYSSAHNFIYLGRKYSFPVALEGALKLKEISYIHAEGYPAAEMKHGPIALIDEEMPVVILATRNTLYDKVLSNIQEIKARQGKVIAVVTEGDDIVSKIADTVITVPQTIECLEPLLTTVPLQLLSYHIAVNRGLDVDKPRNLAKSVTVE